MSALSDYMENKLIDWLFRGQSLPTVSTLYFALYTVAPSDSGGGTQVSGGGYARAVVSASLATFAGTQGAGSTTASTGWSGTTSNNVDIIFPAPSGAWGTVVGMGVFDAATGGNLIAYGEISPSKTVNGGDMAPKFTVGQWEFAFE